MALITLPRGPVETVESWYAGCRLGVSVTVVIHWSKMQKPQVLYYISKCKEKGAAYSLCVFEDVLKRIDISRAKRLLVWSDGGKHFRCKESIATIGVRGCEYLNEHSLAIKHDEKACAQTQQNDSKLQQAGAFRSAGRPEEHQMRHTI